MDNEVEIKQEYLFRKLDRKGKGKDRGVGLVP